MNNNHSFSSHSSQSPCFELEGVVKRFYGVAALDGVDLRIQPGRIHALIGENGAGKSTLINTAVGVLRPDEGRLLLEGNSVHFPSPLDASAAGILVVHQEADLFGELSLAENMLLEHGLKTNAFGLIDWRGVHEEAKRELGAMEVTELNVQTPAKMLSVGRRVTASIAAMVARSPRVLFLDEPTASLTHLETQRLFQQLRRLKAAGVGIVYVSHRLEELLEICDDATVLRDGRRVHSGVMNELTMDALIALMVGRENKHLFSRQHSHASISDETALELHQLTSPDGCFSEVSLKVKRGEIVGLYGLVGAGRSDLAQAVFGLLPVASGNVRVFDQPHTIHHPSQAVNAHLAYLPEDRLTQGIFPTHSCASNATSVIAHQLGPVGFISSKREQSIMAQIRDRFRVKLDSPKQAINTLSGGNQQKIVLGRWIEASPEILILDEPTRGVDVGAKAEIHKLIDELAQRGKAILMISSELPEIMGMSDRVLVMAGGRVTGEFDPTSATAEMIAAAAIPRTASVLSDQKTDTSAQKVSEGIQPLWSKTLIHLLNVREIGIGLVIIALFLCMSLINPEDFGTVKNLMDILTSSSITAIAAAGMTLAIITGAVDISVGSMLGLVGAAAAMLGVQGLNPVLCMLFAIGFGSVLGCCNSILSTLGRINSIVVTLAGLSIYRGCMTLLTGGREILVTISSYRAMGDGVLYGIPKVVWYAIGIALIMHLILNRTLLGRHFLAVGNSEKASRLIGIQPWKVRLIALGMLGALIGLASGLWVAYYWKVQSHLGTGFELQVIAAAVIGGCSISGGRGTILGACLGAILMSLIRTSLVMLKIDAYWENFFIGVLILGAVSFDVCLPYLTAWLQRHRATIR